MSSEPEGGQQQGAPVAGGSGVLSTRTTPELVGVRGRRRSGRRAGKITGGGCSLQGWLLQRSARPARAARRGGPRRARLIGRWRGPLLVAAASEAVEGPQNTRTTVKNRGDFCDMSLHPVRHPPRFFTRKTRVCGRKG